VTKAYVNGHFDKPAIYICGKTGDRLIFNSDSFSSKLNRRAVTIRGEVSQLFYDCVYFVTTPRPLDSISRYSLTHLLTHSLTYSPTHSLSKHVNWVLAKVSNDTAFDNELSDDAAIETLRNKVLERFPHDKLATLDLLRAYIHDNFTTNVLVVE
jgi:hypothetical protein